MIAVTVLYAAEHPTSVSTATSPFNFLRFGGLAPPWMSRGSYIFTASLPTLLGDHSDLLYAQCLTGYVQHPLYLGMVARVRVERTYSRLMRPDETVSSRYSGPGGIEAASNCPWVTLLLSILAITRESSLRDDRLGSHHQRLLNCNRNRKAE